MSPTSAILKPMRPETGEGQVAVCPACGSLKCRSTGVPKKNGYVLWYCDECHLRFSAPMVAADSDWYSSSWLYGLREASAALIGAERPTPWNFAKALSAAGPGAGRKLLDVGCAEGHFLHLARKSGFEVTGLDFNPWSLKIATEVFQIASVRQCSVEELAVRFPGAAYDVVTSFEVLEHTADPFATVCSLTKVMKPGGLLLLSVPGLKRWPALFHPEVDSPPHHLTLWTKEALLRILERAGLHVISIEAKPLQVDDFGVHLRWRIQGALRRARSGRAKSGRQRDQLDKQTRSGAMSLTVRRIGAAALTPLCATLRLHPRSGGFTLLVACQKP